MTQPIHVGIGGWDYDPWRGAFYPAGLAKTKQLHFASRQVTAIEVNATYYKLQRPELYERWAADVPDGFVFTIKGSRFCTNRKVLGDGGDAIDRFCAQGFTCLGPKLGPILWQLADTKKFDVEDMARFLDLLPRERDGIALQHAVEARHQSFADPRFVALARDAGVAICLDDAAAYPMIADATADFAYARLMSASEEEPAGYPPDILDRWAARARAWSQGAPDDLPRLTPEPRRPRETFLFMINGAKVRAPAAAQALLARLGTNGA